MVWEVKERSWQTGDQRLCVALFDGFQRAEMGNWLIAQPHQSEAPSLSVGLAVWVDRAIDWSSAIAEAASFRKIVKIIRL
jgi:hypothetical protein